MCVQLIWRAIGVYRIRRAGPRPLAASKHVLWRDPGESSSSICRTVQVVRDGAPAPPFTFVEEHSTGSQPCVSVRDARGRRWRVKWGHEVRSENFAVRLVWACGYFAETTLLRRVGDHRRAPASCSARGTASTHECRFADARFELDDPDVKKMFEEHSWAWNDNPFVGTPRAAGPQDSRDAAVGLGHEGPARRGARIEHRDLRAPGVAVAPRSALSHHRLGRVDGPLGQQRRHTRTLGSGRLRGADAGVRRSA